MLNLKSILLKLFGTPVVRFAGKKKLKYMVIEIEARKKALQIFGTNNPVTLLQLAETSGVGEIQ